jgi:hypothetical protein
LNESRWWNPLTPDQYWQMGTVAKNRAASWVNQASADITGELFQGWAGPISFAAVAEVAQQGYHLSPDPRAASTSTCRTSIAVAASAPAIRPASSSRSAAGQRDRHCGRAL